NGAIKQRSDGNGDLVVSDAYLRQEFPPPGKAKGRSGGTMPTEQLKDRVADLSDALDKLEEAFKAVAAVTGKDGSPLVDIDGVDVQFCLRRRQLLSRIGDELNFWGRTWRRRHGTPVAPITTEDTDDEDDGVSGLDDDVDEDEGFEDAKEGADDE